MVLKRTACPRACRCTLARPAPAAVNVNSYMHVDQSGDTWVVGFDDEPEFEIVLEPSDGQVLDPYGNQIGYCSFS